MMRSAGRLPKPALAPKPRESWKTLSRSVRNLSQMRSAMAALPMEAASLARALTGCFGLAAFALALVGIEIALAQADRFRRHLAELVIGDIGDRLLQGHEDRRRQPDRLVGGLGADIGELLGLGRVDVDVVAAAMRADDHALIDRRAGRDEHRPALFQVPQRISDGVAARGRDEDAVAPPFDRAAIGRIAMINPAHHAGAARIGEEFAEIADEAARRRV